MKIKVITQVVNGMLSRIMCKNKQAYCDLHGYEFVPIFLDSMPSANNFNILQYQSIKNNLNDCDWLWFTHPLSFIMNPNISLESFVQDTDKDLITTGIVWKSTNQFNMIGQDNFFKNSEWTNTVFFSEFERIRKLTKDIQGSKKIGMWVDMEIWDEMYRLYPTHFKLVKYSDLISYPAEVLLCDKSYQPGNFILHYNMQIPLARRHDLQQKFETETETLFGSCLPDLDVNNPEHIQYLKDIGAI